MSESSVQEPNSESPINACSLSDQAFPHLLTQESSHAIPDHVVVEQDSDGLFSLEVAHDMNLAAMIQKSFFQSLLEDFDGFSPDHELAGLSWEGLPVLSNEEGGGEEVQNEEFVTSHASIDMLLESLLQENSEEELHLPHLLQPYNIETSMPELASSWLWQQQITESGSKKRKTCSTELRKNQTKKKLNSSGVHYPAKLLDKLVACAQAMASNAHQHAKKLLNQIQALVSPYGDAMQRNAFFFGEALRARVEGGESSPLLQLSESQKKEGYQMMYKGCPFIPFAHFATNSMIMEAVQKEAAIHIIDLGMESGLQWLSFLQSLKDYKQGGHAELVRITAVGESLEKMKEAGEELGKLANTMNLRFEFRAAIVKSLDKLKPKMLDLRQGEALVVNCVLRSHGYEGDGLCPLLHLLHKMSPKIMTLVEQDAHHNGPQFVARFKEAFHYYEAIFECLDMTMPRSSIERAKIEQFYLRDHIHNIVCCEGGEKTENGWRRKIIRAGFQPFSLSILSLKARLWLASRSDNCDEYTLTQEKNNLILGWRDRPIIRASAWRC